MSIRLHRSIARALIAAACALGGGLLAMRSERAHRIESKVEFKIAAVLAVLDADTLSVSIDGEKHNLRLIGIDAFETHEGKRAQKQARLTESQQAAVLRRGQEGAAFVRRLVSPGDNLKVEFDRVTTDRYGRLLGYVFLPSGEMLNLKLIKAGLARPLTIPPNSRYEREFQQAATPQ